MSAPMPENAVVFRGFPEMSTVHHMPIDPESLEFLFRDFLTNRNSLVTAAYGFALFADDGITWELVNEEGPANTNVEDTPIESKGSRVYSSVFVAPTVDVMRNYLLMCAMTEDPRDADAAKRRIDALSETAVKASYSVWFAPNNE